MGLFFYPPQQVPKFGTGRGTGTVPLCRGPRLSYWSCCFFPHPRRGSPRIFVLMPINPRAYSYFSNFLSRMVGLWLRIEKTRGSWISEYYSSSDLVQFARRSAKP